MNAVSKIIFKACALSAFVAVCAGIYVLQDRKQQPAVSSEPPRRTAAPSPRDGMGTATVAPGDDVRAGSSGTWTLTYTTGASGIGKGGGVAFHISPFWGWTAPQMHSPSLPGYSTVTCSNPDVQLDITVGSGLNYVVSRTVSGPLAPGDTITLVYGDTSRGTHPGARSRADRYAERHERFFIKVDGDGDGAFFAIARPPTITIVPDQPSRLLVWSPSVVVAGRPFRLKVCAVDAMDNWVESFSGPVTVTPAPEDAQIRPGASAAGIATFECVIPMEGIYHFSASDNSHKLQGRSNPVLCKQKAPRLNLYWADLHGHSQLSDGTGTPDDYYRYARYASGLDAAALTDHDAWGFEPLDENEPLWMAVKQAATRANAPGAFISFIGYEWTNWKFGHKHVLYESGPAPLYSSRDPGTDTPQKLWEALKSHRAMTISHHVGGGPVPADWNYYDPACEPVVEICSIHGNSECLNCPESIYNPAPGSFVRDALARGYHLGIIASGDTHNGHPGMGDPLAPTSGVAGIYAENLSRAALWRALQARRTYATSGERIIVDFSLNGNPMGSVITANAELRPAMDIDITGSARLRLVEIIKNNRTLHQWQNCGMRLRLTYVDAAGPSQPAVYYVRAIQENGHMAWSSPIWVEQKTAGPSRSHTLFPDQAGKQ